MNAAPLLNLIAKSFNTYKFEAVMIGNAAAALYGAPVTTLDIDFMFRKTPLNLKKLKQITKSLEAVVLRPYYPASQLYRIVKDGSPLQIDLMPKLDGIKSFASLRARARQVSFGAYVLWVAALDDIIKSKRAANRPQDKVILPVLEETLRLYAQKETKKN